MDGAKTNYLLPPFVFWCCFVLTYKQVFTFYCAKDLTFLDQVIITVLWIKGYVKTSSYEWVRLLTLTTFYYFKI